MAFKKTRNIKVLEQSGYKYKPTPAIMLKGKWLAEAGFEIGTNVSVVCEDGKLIITPREAANYVDVFETSTVQTLGKVAEKDGRYR